MRSSAVTICLLVLLLTTASTRFATAAPFYVRARTTAIADGFGVPNPYNASSDTGEVPLTAISAANLNGSIGSPFYNAFGASSAFAEVGSLHASASFAASSSGPGVGANGFGQAWWGDTVTITSSTLPLGTPVTFQATVNLHRVISGSGSGVVTALVSGPFGLSINDSRATPNPIQSVTTVVHTTIGSQISVFSTLSVGASGSVLSGQSSSGSIDASNTSTFTFTPITVGASYSTASGVTFVPEPSTYALAAIGVVGLLAFMRRP